MSEVTIASICDEWAHQQTREHDWTLDTAKRMATDALQAVKAAAWDEGAKWAAVECGAIRDERNGWIAPGDNPYRAVSLVPGNPEPSTPMPDGRRTP